MARVLAVVVARGGSLGVPRKNLQKIAGKTLVEHSVAHALNSESVDRVILSTDSREIAEIGAKAGAEVPFLRPAELALPETLDQPVFEHAINFIEKLDGYVPDAVVHLRPTAPYRKCGWIDSAVRMFLDNKECDSVRSVSLADMHPYRMFDIDKSSGFLKPIMGHRHSEPYTLRRQDLPEIYFYNCVIDVTSPGTIRGKKSMTGDNILPFIIPPDLALDIDTPADLNYVRYLVENHIEIDH